MLDRFVVGSLGLALAAALTTQVQAKTLVYCSEGSPEGFNPQLYTAGTTFDASSRTIYNRLVEFERRHHQDRARARRELGHLGRRPGVHLPPAPGRQVPDHQRFHADAAISTPTTWSSSFERQLDPNHPYPPGLGGTYEYFDGMGMPSLLKAIEKVDDMTVRFVLNRPEAPFLANLAMDFASIISKEYADRCSMPPARPRSST